MSQLEFAYEPVPEGPYVMNPLEVACSVIDGADPSVRPLSRLGPTAQPLSDLLEAAVLPALARPPCLVSFSGGRDSSALLAVAAHAARRHGLDAPIPATNRFPAVPEATETGWQELVIGHLGLDDWIRVDVDDELDIVGPLAAPYLRRHGVLWPFNFHFLSTIGPMAAGGTIITGVGGDEITFPSVRRGVRILAGELRPGPADLRPLLAVAAPRRFRVRREANRLERLPWLNPGPSLQRSRALAGQMQTSDLWWGSNVLNSYWRSRYRRATVATIGSATKGDPSFIHPFMDPDFLRGAAGVAWKTGFSSREAALERIAGNLLPAAVIHRPDKVGFGAPLFNRHSRAFVASWDGTGLDPDVVDIGALRRTWSQKSVDARSFCLLQAAWLAQQPRDRR